MIMASIISFIVTFMIDVPASFEEEFNEVLKTQDDRKILTH
jgi:hypothetical protein